MAVGTARLGGGVGRRASASVTPIGGPGGQGIPAWNPTPAAPPTPVAGSPGAGAAQAASLLNPPPITADTPTDPGQAAALTDAQNYSKGLSNGSNDMIQRALGRQRDEISVGIKGEGEAAMGRGADPSLFRSRAVDAGARQLSDLQGKLTDVALGRQNEAINTEANAAGSAASLRNQLHLGTLAQRLAEQRAETERAEAQQRMYDAPYQRLMDMMKNSPYGGGGGGGPYGGGGGGPYGGGSGGGSPGGLGSPGGGYTPPASYKGPTWKPGSNLG